MLSKNFRRGMILPTGKDNVRGVTVMDLGNFKFRMVPSIELWRLTDRVYITINDIQFRTRYDSHPIFVYSINQETRVLRVSYYSLSG